MPAINVDTISGIACLDNTGCACIQTGGCCVLNGNLFCSYGMEYKKCVDPTWCQYPNPLTCGSLDVGVTYYDVTIPNLDTNTCYQYHAIACRASYGYSGTTLSINTPAPAPWISTPLVAGPLAGNQYCITIPGLSASTCYQYRSVFMVSGTCYYGNVLDGATQPKPVTLPSVMTGIAPHPALTDGYFTCGHCVCDNGGLTIQEYGILYTANPSYNNDSTLIYANVDAVNVCKASTCASIAINTPYSDSTTGLPANTTTYYRAFAKNALGTSGGTIYSKITAALPSLTIFAEICTDLLNFCIEGAAFLRRSDGSSYGTLVVGSPTTNCCSCIWTCVPAGCYYMDYSSIHLWCNHAQQSENGVNWSDNTSSGYDQCCTHCFSTNNSVYGCIY